MKSHEKYIYVKPRKTKEHEKKLF